MIFDFHTLTKEEKLIDLFLNMFYLLWHEIEYDALPPSFEDFSIDSSSQILTNSPSSMDNSLHQSCVRIYSQLLPKKI